MSRPPKSRSPSSGAASSRRARTPWAIIAVALVISAALAMVVLELTAPRPKPAPTIVSIVTPQPPAASQAPAPSATLKPPGHDVPLPMGRQVPRDEPPPAEPPLVEPRLAEPQSQNHAALPSSPSVVPSPPMTAPAPPGRAPEEPTPAAPLSTVPSPPVTAPPSAAVQLPDDTLPAWKRYAVAAPRIGGRPMIAIVIDDMGLDQRRSAEVVALPAPLTLSYLPYGRDLARQTQAAHRNGHELMLHIPMQPQGTGNNPGPNALTTALTPAEIKQRLDQALGAFDGYVGVNNHMGSLFTVDRARMDVVMAELKARGLLFLDSRTVQRSVGMSVAAAHDVPSAGRNVFLDNEISAGEVTHQLAETERIARHGGLAIAIGHPHDVTIAALKAWLPTLASKGFAQVPVSAVVARLEARRNAPQTTAVPQNTMP